MSHATLAAVAHVHTWHKAESRRVRPEGDENRGTLGATRRECHAPATCVSGVAANSALAACDRWLRGQVSLRYPELSSLGGPVGRSRSRDYVGADQGYEGPQQGDHQTELTIRSSCISPDTGGRDGAVWKGDFGGASRRLRETSLGP
jgi:hypothetical protein